MFEDKKWDKTFKDRLARHYDELKWLYSELYHNDQQAFNYFCDMMYEYYEKRSPMLREWDEAREASPDWYKGNDMLGMLMYTNCFAGNLKGVKSHLDYIQECGVNYLHLMPLLESPKDRSDGGYAVSNFRKVQPELGTMEDLAELADDCHTRGMCERRSIRTVSSSMMTGPFRTSSRRPFPRCSLRPRPAISPGARR